MGTDIALQNDFNGDMFMVGMIIFVAIVVIAIDRGWMK